MMEPHLQMGLLVVSLQYKALRIRTWGCKPMQRVDALCGCIWVLWGGIWVRKDVVGEFGCFRLKRKGAPVMGLPSSS